MSAPDRNSLESDAASRTRPTLLLRVRDTADAEAWRTFVDVYAPLVYAYCRRRGLQEADAADVAQDVMTEAARCLPTFEYRPERGRFRDWLGTLTRRRLARFFGANSRRKTVGDAALEGAAAPPDAEWVEEFHGRMLHVGLERVRPRFEAATWRAFEMTWLEDRPPAEVARDLGLPVEAVYVAKSRALKALREVILELADDVPRLDDE